MLLSLLFASCLSANTEVHIKKNDIHNADKAFKLAVFIDVFVCCSFLLVGILGNQYGFTSLPASWALIGAGSAYGLWNLLLVFNVILARKCPGENPVVTNENEVTISL